MEWSIPLIVGIVALVAGYMEYKFHPFVGIVTQVIALLVVLAVGLAAAGAPSFIGWFTASAFMTYITVIALGLFVGNSAAEIY